MDNHVTAGRLAPIALGALLVVAGCAGTTPAQSGSSAPSAVATQSSVRSSDTSPDSGPTATRVSPTTATSTPRTSTPTATREGPAAGATPVFIVTRVPTFYCDVSYTQAPDVVVYDDGTVLSTDGIGAYCDEVPGVRVGTIDLDELDTAARSFFNSPDADVDLSELPVTDLPNTTISYRPHNRTGGSISVYGLGAEKIAGAGYVAAEQLRARRTLAALVDSVSAKATHGPRWTPDRLVVVGGLYGGKGYDNFGTTGALRRWPLPLTDEVRTAVQAHWNHPTCATVTGTRQVGLVLDANGTRLTAARWLVEGHEHPLAIGLALPGFPACG